MAITQKMIKEEIDSSEKMIKDTVNDLEESLGSIRMTKMESDSINLSEDEALGEELDKYAGLQQTLQYYTGHLNALEWVLKKMREKNKEKSKGDK